MAAKDDQPAILEDKASACKICLKKEGRYTCPRCQLRYCSVDCYKSEAHAQCSETFYRDCFIEGLKDYKASPDDRAKVLGMLSRLEQENPELDSDDDVDDEADLAQRIDGLDLDKDTEKIWTRLTDQEKHEFQMMLMDGRLGNAIDLWDPWWKIKDTTRVEEVGADMRILTHPKILHSIPEISTLIPSGRPVSPLIPYTIVNVLYAYAYITRLHNGDHMELPRQTAKEVCFLSEGLGGKSFETTNEAVQACIQCTLNQKQGLFVSTEFSVAVVDDVKHILEGSSPRSPLTYTMAALSETHKLLHSAKKHKEKEIKKRDPTHPKYGELRTEKSQLFSACKKVEFLLSWCHRYGLALRTVTTDVEIELCSLSSDLKSVSERREALETKWGGKVPPKKLNRFIEEIN